MLTRFGSVTYRWARRIVVAVIGGTTLILGAVMLIAPGPGLLVIPLGLAILGLEFAWARLWLRKFRGMSAPGLRKAREQYDRLKASLLGRKAPPDERPPP